MSPRIRTPAEASAAQQRWRSPGLRPAWWVVGVLAIALVSWQPLPLTPSAVYGPDSSWQAALQMAVAHGVGFGAHFAFTYGPLGFLSVPTLWFPGLGALALFYALAVRVSLAAALFAGARHSYGTGPALLIALLVSSASPEQVAANYTSLEPVAFLVLAVWVVDRVADERRLRLAVALGGALAGLELLGKLSVGIEITALAVVMALCARGRRREHIALVACGLVAVLLAGWLVTGQELSALPEYLRNSEQIVGGYAAALGYEQPTLGWEYTAAWVAFAFGLIGALQMGGTGSPRRRWGILLLWLLFCFFEFKEGFVRHDSDHAPVFFIALMGGFLAIGWARGRRGLGLAMSAALFVFALASDAASLASILRPGPDVSSAVGQIAEVVSGSKSTALTAAGRSAVRSAYPLTPATLGLLRGHSVDVEPYEADIAWAYDLHWQPLPVIQSYSAYTPTLDQLNATALASSAAPQRILRTLEAGVDGRYQPFDDPATTRALLCHYRELQRTSSLQVLARRGNRCSPPHLLARISAGWNQAVAVPAPPNTHSFVFVSIRGVQVGGLESLGALLNKPAERIVELDGNPFRLVEGTAADGLLLRAAGGVDYPAPWNLAPGATSIAVSEGTVPPAGGKPISYSFYYANVR